MLNFKVIPITSNDWIFCVDGGVLYPWKEGIFVLICACERNFINSTSQVMLADF